MANLGIIDADPSEPPTNGEVVELANRLLKEFNIPSTIGDIEDICAALFVLLYENLFSERLNDIIRQPVSKEDEIHNCQTVIDVLSMEVVRDNLSHIRGVDIVDGDITAISNLLDIFSYLLDYVANRIDSDFATDNEDGKSVTNIKQESDFGLKGRGSNYNQPSIKHKPSMDDVPPDTRFDQRKSRVPASIPSNDEIPWLNRNDNRSAWIDSSSEVDRDHLEKPPSPIQPDQSQSFLGQKTIDSTDLELQYGKDEKSSLQEPPKSKVAWEESPGLSERQEIKEDDLDTGATEKGKIPSDSTAAAVSATIAAATATLNDLETDLQTKAGKPSYLWNSMPPSGHVKETDSDIRLRSTVGPINYHDPATVACERDRDRNLEKGLTRSYNDLREMVERTAAMTRVALTNSPVMGRVQRDLNKADITDEPRPSIPSDAARLAKELNAREMRGGKAEVSPRRSATKKVAFSSSTDAVSDRLRNPLVELRDNEYTNILCRDDCYVRRGERGRQDYKAGYDYGSLCDGYKSRSKPVSLKSPKPTTKTDSFAKHLARSRQPELGAAHMKLKTEDRAIKKKQEFLEQLYQEDLGEFSEDVHSLLNKYNKASREKEREMLKSYQESKSSVKDVKKSKRSSSSLAYKKPRLHKKSVSTKSHPGGTARASVSSSRPLKLESEDDLLPFLIEEFPHLHLSDHTWHELCRKGLHQIEAITRVYQETKRKKSCAQIQLEEAAHRHDLLATITRKELEHTKRMRELKEQKVHHVQLKNKTHEKRAQSARACRYYNEFQVQARSKQLKRRTREETVFRDLFQDALKIQRERIKDIRQYASDQRNRQESRRQNEMESSEKFYQDQFQMLAEKLSQERKDTCIRDKAQQQMVERMRRELRKKMESEIHLYQEQMFRDDDDAHFRQMDADQVKRQLHVARYATQI